jgi:DMSO/TMAO reductase YedYZ molybdopterin-dependent catalytic subunit
MSRILRGAASGVLAAGFGVAVAELLAAATRPRAGPLVAVGGAVIDATPTPIKELAVRELGAYDKPVLLGSIVVVLALFTAVVGVLARRRRRFAVIGAAVFGLAGAAAAVSRPAAVAYDAVPSLVGAAVAGVTLLVLTGRRAPALPPAPAAVPSPAVPSPSAPGSVPAGAPATLVAADRRAFLRAASLVAGGAVLAGTGAGLVRRNRGGALARARDALTLPAAADPARPLPTGTDPGFVTANADFYRVDTALTIPRIDVDTWSLRVHGMVGQEVELSFADLLDRPLIERDITLNCVSNQVGGPYIGTARWLGVPLAPLLRELGVKPGADQVVARSVEGMTIGTPVETVLDGRDTMLCVGMNGEPLPLVHGFPVRMLTPGLYGYAGACKWMTELELTTFADFDAYWVRRGWAARGPVKTASRIDRPQPFAQVAAGPVTVAGVAWAQGRGIRSVEVRVDDGAWNTAELLPTPSTDTWVQWRWSWAAEPGPHTLTVRATDGTGAVQVERRATPFPDGATGWHSITMTAG